MTTAELKKNFHDLIDNIDNENVLINFYEIMKTRVLSENGKLWKMFSKSELIEIQNAISQSKNPQNLFNNSKMKKKHEKWL